MVTPKGEDFMISSRPVDDGWELMSNNYTKGSVGNQPQPNIKNDGSVDITMKKKQRLTERPLLEMLGVHNIPSASTFEKPSFYIFGVPVHKELEKETKTFKHKGIIEKKKEKKL